MNMDFLAQDITLSGHELMAWISAILIFASSFRYMHSIIVWKTKPNVVGWTLYQIATICVLVSSYELGAMSTIVASLAYGINQLIIIALAVYYGYAKINKIETIYFGISMLSLIWWIVLVNFPDIFYGHHIDALVVALVVLMINTFIDMMWAVSIFTKLYKHPETEDSIAWFLAFLSGLFSFLAIEELSTEELIYPIYLVVSNLAIWLLCFRKIPKHRFAKLFNFVERISGKSWRE
jgi:hypothetical protein